jgi:hypothetical protein
MLQKRVSAAGDSFCIEAFVPSSVLLIIECVSDCFAEGLGYKCDDMQ